MATNSFSVSTGSNSSSSSNSAYCSEYTMGLGVAFPVYTKTNGGGTWHGRGRGGNPGKKKHLVGLSCKLKQATQTTKNTNKNRERSNNLAYKGINVHDGFRCMWLPWTLHGVVVSLLLVVVDVDVFYFVAVCWQKKSVTPAAFSGDPQSTPGNVSNCFCRCSSHWYSCFCCTALMSGLFFLG